MSAPETPRTWKQGSEYPMPGIPIEPRGCWATVVIDPESFEPREASAVEIEEIGHTGVSVERLFIRPSEPSLSEQHEASTVDAERELLREIAEDAANPVFEDKRVKYVEIQIDRDTWKQLADLRENNCLSGEEGSNDGD